MKVGKITGGIAVGDGSVRNWRQEGPGWGPKGGHAGILGAGGAARAVIAALVEVGVPEILISNRTKARAEKLKTDFGKRLRVVDWVQAGNMLEEAATVINTTSLGMVGKPPLRVPLDGLQKGTLVTDLVYAP